MITKTNDDKQAKEKYCFFCNIWDPPLFFYKKDSVNGVKNPHFCFALEGHNILDEALDSSQDMLSCQTAVISCKLLGAKCPTDGHE